MSKKIQLTLSPEIEEALAKIMKEDLQTNRAGYIVALIGAEAKRRTKKPMGRPKNTAEDVEEEADYTDDMPKNIPHFGRMIGKREKADIDERDAELKQFTQAQG